MPAAQGDAAEGSGRVGVSVTAGPGSPVRPEALRLNELPRRAREQGWPVTEDHCFGRIVLDGAVGGCWYDVLDRGRSPAFEQLDDAQLTRAVPLAEQMAAEGEPRIRALDARSLAWRGKRPKPSVRLIGLLDVGGAGPRRP